MKRLRNLSSWAQLSDSSCDALKLLSTWNSRIYLSHSLMNFPNIEIASGLTWVTAFLEDVVSFLSGFL